MTGQHMRAAATPLVSVALSAAGLWAIRFPIAADLIAAATAASLLMSASVVAYVVAKSAEDKESAQATLKLLLPWCQRAEESEADDIQRTGQSVRRHSWWRRRLLPLTPSASIHQRACSVNQHGLTARVYGRFDELWPHGSPEARG